MVKPSRLDTISIVSRDNRTAARHVLHSHDGISRRIFAQVRGEQSRVSVVGAGGVSAGNNRDRSALVIVDLREPGLQQNSDQEQDFVYVHELLLSSRICWRRFLSRIILDVFCRCAERLPRDHSSLYPVAS